MIHKLESTMVPVQDQFDKVVTDSGKEVKIEDSSINEVVSQMNLDPTKLYSLKVGDQIVYKGFINNVLTYARNQDLWIDEKFEVLDDEDKSIAKADSYKELLDKLGYKEESTRSGNFSLELKENKFKDYHICKGCGKPLSQCTCQVKEEESLDEDLDSLDDEVDITDYEYCGNKNGYQTYRKIITTSDGKRKGIWAAQDQDKKHPPFRITYDQALGYDPIDKYDSEVQKLSRDLGKMLLPRRESKKVESLHTYSFCAYAAPGAPESEIIDQCQASSYEEAERIFSQSYNTKGGYIVDEDYDEYNGEFNLDPDLPFESIKKESYEVRIDLGSREQVETYDNKEDAQKRVDEINNLKKKPSMRGIKVRMTANNEESLKEDYDDLLTDDEIYDEDEESDWVEIDHKMVYDSDGFTTDYTWYHNDGTGNNVFVFGDRDLYRPEDGYYDFETEDNQEAQDWFDNYSTDDDDYDFGEYNDDFPWEEESLKLESDNTQWSTVVNKIMKSAGFKLRDYDIRTIGTYSPFDVEFNIDYSFTAPYYSDFKSRNEKALELLRKTFDHVDYAGYNHRIHVRHSRNFDESLNTEDTVRKSNGKWTNRGKDGEHGEFDTKKQADAQRKAMYANGYKGEELVLEIKDPDAKDVKTDLSKRKGSITQILTDNREELGKSVTKNDLIATVKDLFKKNNLDTPASRKLIVNMTNKKSLTGALEVMWNTMLKGSGLGVINSSIKREDYYDNDGFSGPYSYDGWNVVAFQDVLGVLNQLEEVRYEIENGQRGALTGKSDLDSLLSYIDELSSVLKNAVENFPDYEEESIKKESMNDKFYSHYRNKIKSWSTMAGIPDIREWLIDDLKDLESRSSSHNWGWDFSDGVESIADDLIKKAKKEFKWLHESHTKEESVEDNIYDMITDAADALDALDDDDKEDASDSIDKAIEDGESAKDGLSEDMTSGATQPSNVGQHKVDSIDLVEDGEMKLYKYQGPIYRRDNGTKVADSETLYTKATSEKKAYNNLSFRLKKKGQELAGHEYMSVEEKKESDQVHSDEFQFTCPVCKEKFTSNEKFYKCPGCQSKLRINDVGGTEEVVD